MLQIGNHVLRAADEIDDAIHRDIGRAKGLGVAMNCAQIYVVGPRTSKTLVTEADINRLAAISRSGFKLFVHASYLSGLLSRTATNSRRLIATELEICDTIGAAGYIAHLPKRAPEEIAAAVAAIIEENKPKTKIFLEVESYRPNEFTYETSAKMQQLIEELKKRKVEPKSFGICIDTAHVWAAGVDIAKKADASAYIGQISALGVELIMHLNDQAHALNSGRDAHAPLCSGTIWRDYRIGGLGDPKESGLYAFLTWAAESKIAILLERSELPDLQHDYILIAKWGFGGV